MGKGKRRAQARNGSEQQQLAIPRHLGQASFARPTIVRRSCNLYTIASGVTGAYLGASFTSSNVTGTTEFSGLSAVYQEYRVRAIKLTVLPRYNQLVGNGGAAAPVVGLSANVASAFCGAATGPATGAAALVFQGRAVAGPCDRLVTFATHQMNPSSDLWQSTAGGTTTLSLIGVIAIAMVVCPGYYNGSPLWDVFVEFDTEFRTAL